MELKEEDNAILDWFSAESVMSVEKISSNYYKATPKGNIAEKKEYLAMLREGKLELKLFDKSVEPSDFEKEFKSGEHKLDGFCYKLYSYMKEEKKCKCKFTIARLFGHKQFFLLRLISM